MQVQCYTSSTTNKSNKFFCKILEDHQRLWNCHKCNDLHQWGLKLLCLLKMEQSIEKHESEKKKVFLVSRRRKWECFQIEIWISIVQIFQSVEHGDKNVMDFFYYSIRQAFYVTRFNMKTCFAKHVHFNKEHQKSMVFCWIFTKLWPSFNNSHCFVQNVHLKNNNSQ